MKRLFLLIASAAFYCLSAAPAHADSVPNYNSCQLGATTGPYTLELCLGPTAVVETGPHGAETFQIGNSFVLWSGLSLALNDHGQWALVSDAGTGDPGTLWGQYTGPITVPPIEVFPGLGCESSGTQPGGTLTGNDGQLGFNLFEALGINGGVCFGGSFPRITGVTNQGEVSATIDYSMVLIGDTLHTGSVDYTWNFARQVPEPSTLSLLVVGLLFVLTLSCRIKPSARRMRELRRMNL